jgi:RNA polymerase sigma-70 factor (ECF subfamily)
MISTTSDFATLLKQAQAGDETAAAELVRQYEAEVRIVARMLLGPALRPYLDSLDVVQSVHRSLLRGLQGGKVDVTSPERLVALSITMVRRKIARQWRRHQRQRRLEGLAPDAQELVGRLAELARPALDPARQAQLRDTLRLACESMEQTDRELLTLRMAGHSTAEAARQLGLDPDVVRVRLSRLRKRLALAGVLEELL